MSFIKPDIKTDILKTKKKNQTKHTHTHTRVYTRVKQTSVPNLAKYLHLLGFCLFRFKCIYCKAHSYSILFYEAFGAVSGKMQSQICKYEFGTF